MPSPSVSCVLSKSEACKVGTLGMAGCVVYILQGSCLSLFSLGPSVMGLVKHSHVSQCVSREKELYDRCLPEGKLVTARVLW